MKYIFRDTYAETTEYRDLQSLRKILDNDSKFWEEGTGDSLIYLPESWESTRSIILFKTSQGIYILHSKTGTSPLIRKNHKITVITHYISEEPFDVPDICLCSNEQAYNIIAYYLEHHGERHPEYEWVNSDEYIPETRVS